MTASLASNYDFRSSINGKSGIIEVRIPGSVLDVSFVEVGMVLGKTLAAVAIVAGTSTSPSGIPQYHLVGLRVAELASRQATSLEPSWALVLCSLCGDGSHRSRCPPWTPLCCPLLLLCLLSPL
jgi:hypothetical protein